MFRTTIHRFLAPRAQFISHQTRTTLPLSQRPLSTSASFSARKDTQDKDSLDPSRAENTGTGKDDNAAHSDAAFDPNNTSPEGERASAQQESGSGEASSLDVSPANQKSSKPRDPQEGGAAHSPRTSQSGGGSPNKNGGGKSG